MRAFLTVMICFSAISFFALPVFAQKQGQTLIDSFLKELPKKKGDTDKVKLLEKLSFEYMSVNPDEGIKYGTQALQLAEQKKWENEIAIANNNIGSNYNAKSDYPRAMDYYLKALTINEKLNDSAGIATNSVNIGIIYYLQNDYNKALDYYFKALPVNKNLTAKEEQQLNYLSDRNSDKKELDSTTKNNQKKLAEKLKEGRKQLAANLADIGIVYSSMEDYGKAMEYYQKALVIDDEVNNKDGKAEIYANIGTDYFAQNNYPDALKYSFSSLHIYQELGSKDGTAAELNAIGEAYLAIAKTDSAIPAEKTANLNKAIEYLEQGIVIGKEIGNLNYQIQFSRDISEAYALSGNCDAALQSLRIYTTLKDSVFSDKNKTKLAGLEKQRETELATKLARLESLRKRNETLVIFGGFCDLTETSVIKHKQPSQRYPFLQLITKHPCIPKLQK